MNIYDASREAFPLGSSKIDKEIEETTPTNERGQMKNREVTAKEVASVCGLPHVDLEFDEASHMQWELLVEGFGRSVCFLRFLLASDMVDRDMKWATRIKIRIRLWRICRAVGIRKLTAPQKRVLLSGNAEELWQWERRSGKTLTACLYTLLYQKTPIRLSRQSLHPAIPDPDGAINGRAGLFTTNMFRDMHARCMRAGIKVCDIAFEKGIDAKYRVIRLGMWNGTRLSNDRTED